MSSPEMSLSDAGGRGSGVAAGPHRWAVLGRSPSRFAISMVIVMGVGAILQFWVALYEWAGEGEAEYMQAALAVAHGGIPLVTFPARADPVVAYLLAPMVAPFGDGLLTGRALMILFNLLTALLIALLARRLAPGRAGKIAGVAGAAAYLLSPLSLYYGAQVREESVAAFFVAASLYLLLRERWAPHWANYPISGVMLGLAVLSRRSAVGIGLVWLLWILYTERKTGWMRAFRRSLQCVIPGAAVAVGFFAYVASRTSLAWAIEATFTNTSTFIQVPEPLFAKLEIWGYLILMAPVCFLIPLLLPARMLRERSFPRLSSIVGFAMVIVVTALLVAYPPWANYTLYEELTPYLALVITVNLVLWLTLVAKEATEAGQALAIPFDNVLLLAGWALAFAGLDFAVRSIEPDTIYSGDVLAPLALLFGFWFATLPEPAGAPRVPDLRIERESLWVRRGLSIAVIGLLITSSGVVAVEVFGPSNPQNVPGANGLAPYNLQRDPISETQQVGAYLDRAMRPNDTVFTFDPLYADAANRTTSPAMAQFFVPYLNYLGADGSRPGPVDRSPFPSAPPGMVPSLRDLLRFWNNTHLGWFLVGSTTQRVLQTSSLLGWYVRTQFHPVASFGDPLSYDQLIVMKRGAPPSAQLSPVATVPTGSNPRAFAFVDGTLYSAAENSPFLTFYTTQGQTGTLNLSIPGAIGLAAFEGFLWVGSTNTPDLEILPLQGGTPEIVPVGYAASGFAEDPETGTVFVSTFASNSVSAFSLDPNGTWWNLDWSRTLGYELGGIAVDPTTGWVFVTSTGTSVIDTLLAGNGTLEQVTPLDFAPYSIEYADGGLVVSWWEGWVYHLMIGQNGTLSINHAIFVGGEILSLTLAPSVGAVAVPSEALGAVSLLNATSLYSLGSFGNVSCAASVAWMGTTGMLASADTCRNTTQVWSAPPPVSVGLTGPAGANVTLNSSSTAVLDLPTTLLLYPQVISVTTQLNGSLPGQYIFSISSGDPWLNVTLRTGPSLSGIQALQFDFVLEAIAACGFFFALSLLFYARADRWYPEDDGSRSPKR